MERCCGFKKLFYLIVVVLLSSCTSNNNNAFKESYLIVFPGKEEERQERISLDVKNTKNFKQDFELEISGNCFVSDEIGTYNIEKQTINVCQVYGNVWFGTVNFESYNKKEIFYFHCLGKNPTSYTKVIEIEDGKTITAYEYESYTNINFIIAFSNTYLI